MITILGRLGPPLAWAGLILYLSSRPAKTLPQATFPFADKLVHVTIYAVLGALLARAIARPGRSRSLVVTLALLIAVSFGVVDEWSQSFSEGRSPDVFDVVADAVGALCGAALAMTYHGRRRRGRGS